MRYDEFRDRWQAALRTARLVSHHDRPEETIDLTTTARRWRVRPLPRSAEPFNAGAMISFRWDPFESARAYTCEEDLLTELLGRRSGLNRSMGSRGASAGPWMPGRPASANS